MDGASLETARRRKRETIPRVIGPVWARLVVLACEVGGRWSDETRDFLRHLAKGKVRGELFPVQRRAEAAWLLRWRVPHGLQCSQSFCFVSPRSTLLCGSDGCVPFTVEVISLQASRQQVPFGG